MKTPGRDDNHYEIEHCVLGLRLRVDQGAVLEDNLVMDTDSYESLEERRLLRARERSRAGCRAQRPGLHDSQRHRGD